MNKEEWLKQQRDVLDKLPEDEKERINEQYNAFTQNIQGIEYAIGVDLAGGKDTTVIRRVACGVDLYEYHGSNH